MTPWWRRVLAALRRFFAELARRCRERGRTALLRALRITGATVAAFVVAEMVGLTDPPPLVIELDPFFEAALMDSYRGVPFEVIEMNMRIYREPPSAN